MIHVGDDDPSDRHVVEYNGLLGDCYTRDPYKLPCPHIANRGQIAAFSGRSFRAGVADHLGIGIGTRSATYWSHSSVLSRSSNFDLLLLAKAKATKAIVANTQTAAYSSRLSFIMSAPNQPQSEWYAISP